ncbi:hypothetical protein [Yinghuangia seranimata]|uniref:hypothetical protein n=1 Tax=Yinghuangia seranimata TaxID=408067 RepID=UPI00248CD42F|nr:hypothetical protein [Yinghuangia seranimata]MDI2127194.1 hypothetical protein [Yinghuangia seranimata]
MQTNPYQPWPGAQPWNEPHRERGGVGWLVMAVLVQLIAIPVNAWLGFWAFGNMAIVDCQSDSGREAYCGAHPGHILATAFLCGVLSGLLSVLAGVLSARLRVTKSAALIASIVLAVVANSLLRSVPSP